MKKDYVMDKQRLLKFLVNDCDFLPSRQNGSHITYTHPVSHQTVQVVDPKHDVGGGILKNELSFAIFSKLISYDNADEVREWAQNIKDEKTRKITEKYLTQYIENPYSILPMALKKQCSSPDNKGARDLIDKERENHAEERAELNARKAAQELNKKGKAMNL